MQPQYIEQWETDWNDRHDCMTDTQEWPTHRSATTDVPLCYEMADT